MNIPAYYLTNLYAHEWEDAIDAVEGLTSYQENWDGEGSKAIPSELIVTAVEWLRLLTDDEQLPPPGVIYPTPGGTIMIEWQFPNKTRLSAHIRTAWKVEAASHVKGEEPIFHVVNIDTSDLDYCELKKNLPNSSDHGYSLAS